MLTKELLSLKASLGFYYQKVFGLSVHSRLFHHSSERRGK